ncbi:hypothetical protein BST97_12075 [Nonlabens spongiae]|uniref:Uncharacterized protein n=1 Tax=Nonlabens spongiae TaxID=331648 RepID=A0A1W6MM39_9FLAO|nr:hypothetical protein [Nonlabens spongiae]ARN78668.1 hypothetical protein BST97_12075 [Nonlabens spongiae]
MRWYILFFLLAIGYSGYSQDYGNVVSKRVKVSDSIRLDSVSISPRYFQLKYRDGTLVDSTLYQIDFSKALIRFQPSLSEAMDSLDVQYQKLPDFLTRTYQSGDPAVILDNESQLEKLVASQKPRSTNTFVPFSGLNVSGSISRGFRSGNNQSGVVDSELDLRVTGKLNDRVSLRASIQDANVPQTQNGYSQRLDEFDQIFIELFSEDWNIRAGDVDLVQTDFQFNSFTKRVQGISGTINFGSEDHRAYASAAGALVRGTFNISRFTGQEGNQGPYKLTGQNGELFILVVSGSERVFVNGVPLTRGENADYVIDYNAGEVRFTPTFPITSEMRISIEYQYSERNFTRVIGFANGGYKSEKLQIDTYAYTESDAKNQPLQQNLTEEQVAILAQAGDDESLAVAPSAVPDSFSENKILYTRSVINGQEVFTFSQDPNEELFNVRFSFVGQGNGNYVLINDQAIANIYEYVAPVNGIPQGNFAPVVQLFAPEQLTIFGAKANYQPFEKTIIATEIAASNNDLNRFSELDDENNRGIAAKLGVAQTLFEDKDNVSLTARANVDYVQEDFQNVERVYNIEFNRDWNLNNESGSQLYSTTGLDFKVDSTFTTSYEFQLLEFSDSYSGNRHRLVGLLSTPGWKARYNASLLNSESNTLSTEFNRADVDVVKKIKKNYAGARFGMEDNKQKLVATNQFTGESQRFYNYEVYVGRGDTTSTFVEVGYRRRINDSLRSNEIQRVNASNNYYLKSQLLKDQVSNLAIYANYRRLKSEMENVEDEVSFNSRILYRRKFFEGKILSNTTYETNSASIARQDFTYVSVNPGQGTFTWIDYNNDGVQELNEFEVAQFQDQASFVRVLLPNQIFLPTHQNKFSQTLTLQPASWSQEEGLKKILSQFYNQIGYTIDRMVLREGDAFNLNPFRRADDQQGLNLSFRNSLFFNRGKQRYTTNYTYLSTETENLQSIGSIASELESHQLSFLHKIAEQWLITFNAQIGFNSSSSENFPNRNFKIDENLIKPQISYLFNDSNRIDLFFEYQDKKNEVNDLATLSQSNLGVTWSFNESQKYAINGELRYVNNVFEGVAFSPAGFQMLEGLQPGSNLTWNLLFQKKLTSYLDLNLNYNGRGTESSRTVHNGSVQLKAYF